MNEIITTTAEFPGGCACGVVRYVLLAPPMFVNCCHCSDCQRQTGSAFAVNAVIETDRIALRRGQPEPVRLPTASGDPHDIYCCPVCRVCVWNDYGGRPHLRFVRVGTLDDPAAFPPDAHIFTRSKLPWITLPPDKPAFAAFYDMKVIWPAASLARRYAASGRTA